MECWSKGVLGLTHHSINPSLHYSKEGHASSPGHLYVGYLDVEVEGFSRQRVVEIDHDGLLFHLVDAHGDRFPSRAFGCQHGSNLLRLARELVLGNSLEGVRVSAITILGFDHDFLLIADLQSRQLLFKTRHDLSAAVEVG